MSSLTLQIGRKSAEQHGCHESRSTKLTFSDFPAYCTTVLHKYNSPAVFFLRKDTEEGAFNYATFKFCRHFINIYELVANLVVGQEELGYFHDYRIGFSNLKCCHEFVQEVCRHKDEFIKFSSKKSKASTMKVNYLI